MTDRDQPRIPLEPIPGVGSTIPGPFDVDYHGLDRDQIDNLDASVEDRRPRQLTSAQVVEYVKTPFGYGTDPNVITPNSPWSKTLTQYERTVISALGDIILPADSDAPAPSQVGIAEFFDDWLSAPYETQVKDKELIRTGLLKLDKISHTLFAKDFLRLSDPQKCSVVDELIKNEDDQKFFVQFRYLLVGGYFTSDAGMRAIGYRGNIPLRKPAQVSSGVRTIIEQELQKLGL